eukprot:COSAG01_NODE_13180_length_1624_cov_2.019672_3_plen_173_part_00
MRGSAPSRGRVSYHHGPRTTIDLTPVGQQPPPGGSPWSSSPIGAHKEPIPTWHALHQAGIVQPSSTGFFVPRRGPFMNQQQPQPQYAHLQRQMEMEQRAMQQKQMQQQQTPAQQPGLGRRPPAPQPQGQVPGAPPSVLTAEYSHYMVAYDMCMFWGSRTWPQLRAVHRCCVL